MTGVNTAHWLMAIDAHPDLIDTDLVVATALANGDAEVEGIDPETVADSVEELIGCGFLVDVASVQLDGSAEEHVLELRLP